MSDSAEPRTVTLGEAAGPRSKEETFLDGRLVVRSRYGLRPSERALLPALPQGKTGKVLVINSTYGFLGQALSLLNPEMEVHYHYDDAYDYEKTVEALHAIPGGDVNIHIGPDPLPGPWPTIVMPLERQGIVDLVRERIRMVASEWLAPSGLLYTSSDNKEERFIHDEVKKAFGALARHPEDKRQGGIAYVARRPAKGLVGPPRSWTSFQVQEEGKTLEFQSRLGVFCSDRLDPGTRALLAIADVKGARRILDLGCGSGEVGIIAALREPDARVTFLDSHSRAVEATRKNLEAHEIDHRADAVLLSANPPKALDTYEKFDCVLTNPPYYGNWRIAELFLETAGNVLKPGGKLILVTKAPEYYRPRLAEDYDDPQEEKRGGYTVLTVTRKQPAA